MPKVRRSEQVKIFREDYVSVSIYRNTYDENVYYDIVPSRLIWIKQPDGTKKREWRRGANYKPADLFALVRVVLSAIQLLNDMDALDQLSANTLELIKLTG